MCEQSNRDQRIKTKDFRLSTEASLVDFKFDLVNCR